MADELWLLKKMGFRNEKGYVKWRHVGKKRMAHSRDVELQIRFEVWQKVVDVATEISSASSWTTFAICLV